MFDIFLSSYMKEYDLDSFDSRFYNKLVIATVFGVKDGGSHLNTEDHIILKKFPYKVISDDIEALWQNEIKMVYYHGLKSEYDLARYDFEQQQAFEIQHSKDDWTKTEEHNIVFIKFEFTTGIGCPHYLSFCELCCNICNHFYGCRFCHDEKEDHDFPRLQTKLCRCMKCSFVQELNQKCQNCGICFGNYFCPICRYYCDMGPDAKPAYHCYGCNQCMVGVGGTVQHCYKCNQCYDKHLFEQHTCNELTDVCPVCQDDLKTSINEVIQLECKHYIHYHCYDKLLSESIDQCPLCKKFLPIGEARTVIIQEYQKMYSQLLLDPVEIIYIEILCIQCNSVFTDIYNPSNIYQCDKCNLFNCEANLETAKQDQQLVDQFNQKINKITIGTVQQLLKNMNEKFVDVQNELALLIQQISVEDFQSSYINAWNNSLTSPASTFDTFRNTLIVAINQELAEEAFEEFGE